MKIADLIDQLVYTHPVHSHTKKLFEVIKQVEEQYLRRIAELEQNNKLPNTYLEEKKTELVNRDAEPYPGYEYNNEGTTPDKNYASQDPDFDFPYELEDFND